MIKFLLFHPYFKVVFWFRLTSYLQDSLKYFLSKFSYLILKRYELATRIQLSMGTEIGGFVFPYQSGIVINVKASIGKSCMLYDFTSGDKIVGNENCTISKIGDNRVLTCV